MLEMIPAIVKPSDFRSEHNSLKSINQTYLNKSVGKKCIAFVIA